MLTVDITHIHTLSEIENRLIRTILLALFNNRLSRRVAHTLDGTEPEADLSMMVHTELLIRLVDIRSQGIDLHALAFVHQFGDFRNLIPAPTHDGCHELSRIVGFQISRLIGHP